MPVWPSGSSSRSPKPRSIHDIDDTRGFVSRVKDLGCRIAIDDFGSGYTSFRNLRKLGVDILKIDGAFVQNLMRTDDDRAFVSRAGRSRQAAGPQDRRRVGAGRAFGGAARGMGLRLSARLADRARLDRAALGRRGPGRPAQDHASLTMRDSRCDNLRVRTRDARHSSRMNKD